jgi:DNA repair protein RecN (Recombination protein N)
VLAELSIENFAIIDRLLVRLDRGFTVITGETGAGKSIIIDALQAALGARVGSDTVRSGSRLASVEAVFDLDKGEVEIGLAELCANAGIDPADGLILRREINVAGRGTARVNGRAVPIAVLNAVGALLVDIHGQSEHLSVLRRDRQLDALDRFGDLLDLRRSVADAVRRLIAERAALDALLSGRREAEQRVDLLRFQVGEIDAADLTAGEDEELEARRTVLANAERLLSLAASVQEALSGEARSAIDAISAAAHAIRELAVLDRSAEEYQSRTEAALIEVEDIAQEVRRYATGIEADPSELAVVEDRLDLIHRLKRKYGATVADMIAFGDAARGELEDIENVDERLEELQRRVAVAESDAGVVAAQLSESRGYAAQRLSDEMQIALQGLGLKSTGFRAEVYRTPSPSGLQLPGGSERYAYTASGIDTIAFLVSFNAGEELRPLERVASGGETARFLLALKSVLAEADATPTLIFDEVDVGVGGRHGGVVGERLRSLAASHQVIAITHLPQVAALGDHHLTVAKAIVDGRTTTLVREVDAGDRVLEIAEMMSGTGTESARQNAKELLERAARAS